MAIDKEKTLQAAQRAVEKKKYDLAIEEYRKLSAVEKADPRWLLKIGDTQQKKGDFASAIGTYEEVARFYGTQGFHLKAVAVYNTVRDLLNKQAPALQQKYAHVPVKLAELYEKLQLTSDALATWDAIADRLQREGRDREAVDVYRRIVSLDPSNPLAHLRLAEALSRLKDIEGAIAEFAATAEQLVSQKRVDDALKVYERLLHHRQDPKYARPAAELYLSRGGANDGVAAIAKIQICLKSDPKSVELIALLARGFAAIGQADKALTIYKEAARLAGEQNKTELRKDIVKRLMQLAPNDEGVRLLYAEVIQGMKPASVAQQTPRGGSEAAQMPVARTQTASSGQAPQQHVQQSPRMQTGAAVMNVAPQQPQRAQQAQQPRHAPPPQPEDEFDDEELEAIDDDEVEFEEREAAEELGDAQQQQKRAPRVAEVIANADAFRKVKLFSKALTTLRIGLELDPRSVPVRERIRDVLIETGETDAAIDEMVSLSAVLLEENDLEGAYDNLAWILEAEPGHPQATQLMEQLQLQVPQEEAVDSVIVDEEPDPFAPAPKGPRTEANARVEPIHEPASDGRLPSFSDDLDETDDPFAAPAKPAPVVVPRPAAAAAVPVATKAGPPRPAARAGERDPAPIDVGFGPQSSGSLPAYELEDGLEEGLEDGLEAGLEDVVEEEPAFSNGPESIERDATASGAAAEVEASLDEADFYAAQGVFETAIETIEESLKSSPRNPLLLEKLRELRESADAKAAHQAASVPGDRAFDIAASLDALDALDEVEQPKFATSAGEQIDVEEVFAKFKEGVAAQVDAGDTQTHYDLGIAYEQMMLFDDAIAEFLIAAKDPMREALCRSMIGMIHIKKGQLAEATEAYKVGLHAEHLTREEELALTYELANVWTMRKNKKEAAYFLKRIVSADPGYRDAKQRLAALGPAAASDKGSGARAVGDPDDDLDAAFDDVMGPRK